MSIFGHLLKEIIKKIRFNAQINNVLLSLLLIHLPTTY